MGDMGALHKGNTDQQALVLWPPLGEEIENAGVNDADYYGNSGGGTLLTYALVPSDKGFTFLRIDF